jgi:hypothetical protein
MRLLTRYLSLISRKTYALPIYFFNKLYTSVFSPLHIFLFLESSKSVKFVLKYDRFLNDPSFKDYNFGNRFPFVVMKEYRFFYL